MTDIYSSILAVEGALLYLTIPIISALVGWGTNWLALKMTFLPLEFRGIPPYIGWQGIIPAKASVMAAKSVDILTTKLLNIKELFLRLEPRIVADEMTEELANTSQTIIDEVMCAQGPLIWKNTPQRIKTQIYQQSAHDLPIFVEEMMCNIRDDVEDMFDVKSMVIESLTKNKKLLNEIFLKVGDQEFAFIERSGLYFGFLFGLVQMTVCIFYNPWWMLPLAGILVGFLTNWLALKLIFEPLRPKKVAGFTLHGLFMKRQKEVASEYAEIVTNNILTIENILDELIKGRKTGKISELIKGYVEKIMTKSMRLWKPLLRITKQEKRVTIAQNIAYWSFMQELPMVIMSLYDYAERALDLKNTLREKMIALPPEDFQGLLRPVFQEDEWKLILVGAILGGLAGALQMIFLFS